MSESATAYADAVLAGEIVAGPYVRAACRRHRELNRLVGILCAEPITRSGDLWVRPAPASCRGCRTTARRSRRSGSTRRRRSARWISSPRCFGCRKGNLPASRFSSSRGSSSSLPRHRDIAGMNPLVAAVGHDAPRCLALSVGSGQSDGRRRFRRAYVETGKGTGKSASRSSSSRGRSSRSPPGSRSTASQPTASMRPRAT